jgi:hypothetical protein
MPAPVHGSAAMRHDSTGWLSTVTEKASNAPGRGSNVANDQTNQSAAGSSSVGTAPCGGHATKPDGASHVILGGNGLLLRPSVCWHAPQKVRRVVDSGKQTWPKVGAAKLGHRTPCRWPTFCDCGSDTKIDSRNAGVTCHRNVRLTTDCDAKMLARGATSCTAGGAQTQSGWSV